MTVTLLPTPTMTIAGHTVSPVFASPVLAPTPTSGAEHAISPLPVPSATPTAPSVPVYTYRVLNAFPHDPEAFTQGLIFQDGILYEGTGLRGRSSLRKVELETGNVLKFYALPEQYFGEGIAIFDNKLFQLTWQSRVGFIYDKETLELLDQFTYSTEGWGLTHDGKRLIMSDGTSTLYMRDPANLDEIGRIQVFDGDAPVVRLNELEYVAGEVWANVWQTNRIARIDPDTGQVVGWIDLSGLLEAKDVVGPVDVLNGIAYDAQAGRIFVTGKLWPRVFEIELLLSR
jgi:glutamine cyclotransferase